MGPAPRDWTKSQIMEANLSLDATKNTRKFDGTLFQNWKHAMEILFEFKDIKHLSRQVNPFIRLIDY